MKSLDKHLRQLFNKNLLYTVEQLSKITGKDEKYIRVMISRLKNKKYCNYGDEPLDLIQDHAISNGVKRWGLRGATERANIEKTAPLNKPRIKKLYKAKGKA